MTDPLRRHRRLATAPMLDWTDRHARMFFRLLSREALLYTEMVTTGAILHGDAERHLAFSPAEHPVALQLGGSDPRELAECSRIGEQFGYDEINLNVGCPSDRVQSGRFGACLMAEPRLVANCVAAMREAVRVPVTVKSRIGIDHQEGYEPLACFVGQVAAAGCEVFIVHARKAWLAGLSPKENREIPPLRYEMVHRLKQDFPHLTIVINGGLRSLDEAEAQLTQVDGVMIGRAAYENPFLLREADRRLYGSTLPDPDPTAVMRAWMDYVQAEWDKGTPLHAMTRHILGAFHGQPGARAFRRHLSELAPRKGSTPEVLREALRHVGIEL
ncbi:MAG: tRNA dihydrouridine(20/20a) synthase DusA [Pseudomonadota bacterium]|jgi:tRNA-dihydrouridine synthase A